jgi:hypothetical protein
MAGFYRFAGPVLSALAGSTLLSGAFASGCNGTGAGTDEVPLGTPAPGTTAGKDAGATTATSADTGTATTMTGDDAGSTMTMTSEDSGSTMASEDSGATMTSEDSGSTMTGPGTTTSWGTPVAGGPKGSGAGVSATVTVNPGTSVGTIGLGFAGFSYEKTHITNDSLAASNAALIALFKLVGSPVVRLGANDVDNCNWAGTGTAPSSPSGQPFTLNITSVMVDDLCGFLAATGSKIIYGVNFKSDKVAASAAEAAYAQGKCGSSIYGFEIGNEINYFGSWASLRSEYESFATAVVATPGALLIGPAGGGGGAASFSSPFAANESAKFGSKLVLLTQHYYAGSSGSSNATPARPWASAAPSTITVRWE